MTAEITAMIEEARELSANSGMTADEIINSLKLEIKQK